MHSPASLESECISWKIVIYFNVLHSVKKILDMLGVLGDDDDGEDFDPADEAAAYATEEKSTPGQRRLAKMLAEKPATLPGRDTSLPGSRPPSAGGSNSVPVSPQIGSPSLPPGSSRNRMDIANLRLRLAPLVATDMQLAKRLNGGTSIAGWQNDVMVRSGWQARAVEGVGKSKWIKRKQGGYDTGISPPGEGLDQLVDDVAEMLYQRQKDVIELWDHPLVQKLVSNRKLRLDEWAD